MGCRKAIVSMLVHSETLFMSKESFSPSSPQIGLGNQPACGQPAKTLSYFQAPTQQEMGLNGSQRVALRWNFLRVNSQKCEPRRQFRGEGGGLVCTPEGLPVYEWVGQTLT